jgi:murein DD-endopeptidase MepM/ murein hydrolase activator NlpD
LATAAAVAAGASTAPAASGGAATSGTGGVSFVAPPKIKAVKCLSACMSRGRVQSGGRIKLRGARLAAVRRVIYRGARGRSDDVSVSVTAASNRSVAVPVPLRAQSGRVDAWAGRGMQASTNRSVTIMPPAAPEPNATLSAVPGAPEIETATSRSLFAIDQRGGVKFSFRFAGEAPAGIEVSLVRVDDGTTVNTWAPPVPAAGETGSVAWNGRVGAESAPDGRYAFRLVTSTATGAGAANAAEGDITRDAFDLRPAVFPIKGRHNYGQSGARFGAGRSGHSHQGQDVMAACGTPLVAARGGRVKTKQYHSAAGNYLVIDTAASDVDMAYMHMASPSPYAVGDRVRTGDQIGVVGTTGSSTACHLHFEEWSAPGWYSGGQPFDPLADLRAWDAYS